MCCRSQREFRQMVVVDISELKIIYPPPPIEERIDVPYALGLKDSPVLNSPIVIDKDNYIIDGHHRWYYYKMNGIKKIDVIKLKLSFDEAGEWRMADREIKQFARRINRPKLFYKFKELVNELE